MQCPKCGNEEIHTWLLCVCYSCGYSGDVKEFNATHQEIDNAMRFREIIIDMKQSQELSLSLGEIQRKNKRNNCAKCGKQEFKRLMFIVNIIDGLTYRHTVTRYYCIDCAKMLFGELENNKS